MSDGLTSHRKCTACNSKIEGGNKNRQKSKGKGGLDKEWQPCDCPLIICRKCFEKSRKLPDNCSACMEYLFKKEWIYFYPDGVIQDESVVARLTLSNGDFY